MKQMILLISIIAASLLSGCGTVIKDMSTWETVKLQKSEFAPNQKTLAQSGGKTKVVIAKFIEPENKAVRKLAKSVNLSRVMAAQLEKYLADAGLEIIDRNRAKSLLREVKLAEARGKAGRYKGNQVAEYVLTGSIDSVDISNKFREARRDKEGNTYAPRCTFKANVTSTLRVYTVPEMRIVKTIKLDEGSTRSEETRRNNCASRGHDSYARVIRQAGEQAVEDVRNEIKAQFASKAYISDMRTKDNKYIIRISIGKNKGVKQGTVVHIFSKRLNTDGLTGKKEIEVIKLTTGKATNVIKANYAWIALDEPEKATKIRIGNLVKVIFEDSWVDSLRRGGKILENIVE